MHGPYRLSSANGICNDAREIVTRYRVHTDLISRIGLSSGSIAGLSGRKAECRETVIKSISRSRPTRRRDRNRNDEIVNSSNTSNGLAGSPLC